MNQPHLPEETPARLEVRGVSKRFGTVQALDDVTLAFAPAEVRGIIGENGAGKSTLMKILAGLEAPDTGSVVVEGQEARLRSAGDALGRGIAMIHQELNLVDDLTVAENVFLGREPKRGGLLDRRRMEAEAGRFLEEVAAPFGPGVRVEDLSIAGKQLVEIAKAVSTDAKVVIMDEPTAVLSGPETEALFALIGRLRERGVTVIYISHLLGEVLRVCERITVMRDGRVVETVPAAGATPAMLARMMVGRELGDQFPPKTAPPEGAPALRVSGLDVPDFAQGVSFEVRPGEIVGLAGLVGSGRTEVAEAIAGLRRRTSGTVERDGRTLGIRGAQDGVAAGIAYLSEDRKGAGLVLPMSTLENTTLVNLRAYARPILNRGKERREVDGWVRRLNVRVGDVRAPVSALSGGNQQKVAVAKWLETRPKVLLLDEPTRGVDVGAKRELYFLIQSLAAEGLACLVISSEMSELLGLCHRILVLRAGRVVGELAGDEMTEERIMMLAAGVEGEAA